MKGPKPKPLAERFWPKVDRRAGPNACWLWTAARNSLGYGVFNVRRGTQLAHRIAFELVHGNIPAGKVVRHRCDVPGCCNPDHLEMGTVADNNHDMSERGRHGRAARKLTAEQVSEIRRMLSNGVLQSTVAEQFGVSRPTICDIHKKKTWRTTP